MSLDTFVKQKNIPLDDKNLKKFFKPHLIINSIILKEDELQLIASPINNEHIKDYTQKILELQKIHPNIKKVTIKVGH